MQLVNGSRVLIVGGGPAGSFTALHLLQLAAEVHLDLKVILFEPKNFLRPGPAGCNKCAGILSSGLVHSMAQLGLALPPDVIQSQLQAYLLHFEERELLLQPPDPDRKIFSVYRGGGPRLGTPPYPASFDYWLQEQACARGAEIRSGPVKTVRRGVKPVVVTAREEVEGDLVILATGINSRAPLDADWGYRAPPKAKMAQDEILNPDTFSNQMVHIFFDHPQGLIFGGIIPKGRYANISLLGKNLPSESVNRFLEGQDLLQSLPFYMVRICGCTPYINVGAARSFFTDRFVAVGDAAVTRLYKDGISSAFFTAEAAARTAILHGVAEFDFRAHYLPVCLRIAHDNRYGKILFGAWAVLRRFPWLNRTWFQAVRRDEHLPAQSRIHTVILWNMLTGDASYQKMFWQAVSLPSFLSLLSAMFRREVLV